MCGAECVRYNALVMRELAGEMMDKKLHWFLISFIAPSPRSGFNIANTTTGFDDRNVTNQRIETAKEAAKIPSEGNVLAVSYLGHMTQDELNA